MSVIWHYIHPPTSVDVFMARYSLCRYSCQLIPANYSWQRGGGELVKFFGGVRLTFSISEVLRSKLYRADTGKGRGDSTFMCLMCALTLRGMALCGSRGGAEGARSLRAMSGKIAHLSNQQTSDFRKQFRGKQPVSVRPGVAHDILVVVVVVVSRSKPPTLRGCCCRASLCAVCAVCARKLLLSIENSTEKPKKKMNENKRNES